MHAVQRDATLTEERVKEVICPTVKFVLYNLSSQSLMTDPSRIICVQVYISLRVGWDEKFQVILIQGSERLVDCICSLLDRRLYWFRNENIELGTHERCHRGHD